MNFNDLTIYLQCSPQTEEVVHTEFSDKCSLLGISPQSNDLVLSEREYTITPRELATILPYLKCPNRVLIRIDQFKVRDFPKLFQKIVKINWSQWIGGPFERIHVTSAKSRLIHTDRIEQSAREAIDRYLQMNPTKKIKQQKWNDCPSELFIRIVDDLCTISLDASGEKLSHRGYRKFVGTAPLRENRAATILYTVLREQLQSSNEIKLADPFVGSGTILLEASQWYFPNTSRLFYLNHFFDYKNSKDALKEIDFTLLGIDQDAKTLQACRDNFALLKTQLPPLKLLEMDFLKVEKNLIQDFIIVTNPPYDERISVEEYFQKNLIHFLSNELKHKNAYLLLPKTKWKLFQNQSKKILAFSNSGIDVELRKIKS